MKNVWDKLFWTLAPFIWGMLTLLCIKISNFTKISGDIFWIIRAILFTTVLYYFFGKIWKNKHSINLQILSYKFTFNTTWIYLALVGSSILSLVFIKKPLWHDTVTFSILFSPTIEELTSKSIFLKYSQMKVSEFLFWNLISASAFSLMHFWTFLLPESQSITLFVVVEEFWQYFFFSFCLCFTVFVTKRLDLAVWLHMFGNLFGYTLKTLFS